MDIFRLNPDTYLPDHLFEVYSSMIWTERLIGFGEFEFKTSEVFPTLDLLPEGSLIGLRNSPEVMLVETRSIDVDADGNQELTVNGRSFETFVENRILLPSVYNEPWSTIKPYTISEMAALLLWNHLVNNTGEDVTRTEFVSFDDKTGINNVVVTDSATIAQTAVHWWLEKGVVYETCQDVLSLGDLGVRSIRPNHTSGTIVTFDTSKTASRGNITKTFTGDIPQLRLDIYNGLDRTRNQVERPSVIFHYDSGHVDDPKYLFSTKDYRTMATVASSIGNVDVYPEYADNTELSGLDRRMLFIDGGDIGDQDYATFYSSLVQKGREALKKQSKLRLFDGAISPVSPYIYGRDYFLGDQVTLLARLGFEQTMIVNEYVRTEDSEGDRGYPGLSSIPE